MPRTTSSANESVLQEAHRIIRGQKRKDYGHVSESFKKIATGWAEIIGAPVEDWHVALCMDWLKTCRFLNSKDRDSLVDKGGYTGLTAQIFGIDD